MDRKKVANMFDTGTSAADIQRIEETARLDQALAEPSPISLIGEHAERYMRFAKAAAALRITGDAHMKAQEEYKQALGLLSASAEKLAAAD